VGYGLRVVVRDALFPISMDFDLKKPPILLDPSKWFPIFYEVSDFVNSLLILWMFSYFQFNQPIKEDNKRKSDNSNSTSEDSNHNSEEINA